MRISDIAARALRTLDLSQVAPSARIEVGYDSATFLYETLSRIELPPTDEIPDASFFDGSDGPAKWTLPHTDITIARVTEGPRKGEFLFSQATVERAREFHAKTQHLPYQRTIFLEDTDKLRQIIPGWWIPMAAIETLPGWMKTVALEQALWKWMAFAGFLLMFGALVIAGYRLVRGERSSGAASAYARRLIVPLIIIVLMPLLSYVVTEQINLIGDITRTFVLITQSIVYLLGTWVAWLGCLLTAELVILSPRVEKDSLNAQLMRLSARIMGIVLGLVIIFYGANQIGIPLVGVLAGVGVGGLAIALAAQDSLKNLLGSLMIFMDQPYKPGQRIVVEQHDGFVEQIGLRSTKVRMLTGALTAIPNERMARLDIENIGRRKFIRRQTNIRLAYETSVEKMENAIAIIKDILNDHEGMQEEWPPRVFFNEFNPDSLNIQVSYWYHPPLRWKALAYDEKFNLEIMRGFSEAGIKLALPTSKTYLGQESGQARQGELGKGFPTD